MVDVDVYTIDNVDYLLIEEFVIGGISYLYLSNVDDKNDVIFRKRDSEDKEILLSLDDEEEVKKITLFFVNKFFGVN